MDERSKRMYDSIGLVDPALPLVQKLMSDPDAGVRAEAQKFLSNFASEKRVADKVANSLGDSDAGVRLRALEALRTSHEPPPMETIEKAFLAATGDVAQGLIELMREREDAELAARLSPGFRERPAADRLMVMSAIAGHANDAALNLVSLGLKDNDPALRRAALMRLLSFPAAKAIAQMKTTAASDSPDTRDVAAAVQRELDTRSLFPFLERSTSVRETLFPSSQGTGPKVSPDGKWIAYVETGWGRPGGSGGMGRSNLLSITHVARSDGYSDKVVSDMFFVGWMSDSRRVASARDGFAAIVDLNGKVVSEFGELLEKPYGRSGLGVWPNDVRNQLGVEMPHTKIFRNRDQSDKRFFEFDYGEDAAFSPDGTWFGPRRVNKEWQFVDSEGHTKELKQPEEFSFWGVRAVWSPDGSHIVVLPTEPSGQGGPSGAIEPRKAFVIDFIGQWVKAVIDVDQVPRIGNWDYRKGRWYPWSRDGKGLTFIRRGQVWTSDPDGGNARQVTFDSFNKVFPTFSPDGARIAYITWQFDQRDGYTQLGPTDIWVVDCKTGLAARVTHPDPARIESLDWLDNNTLIYDRLERGGRQSSLRTASLR
ncbi:MAG TPA: hypothetical protein VFV34_06940, partial [Blastocatellia bacterium]|nr:hypothetical protein [Blastocatellia bacterium]